MGKQWKQWQALFSWAPESLWTVTATMKLKTHAPWKKSYDKPRQCFKKQTHHFVNRGPYNQSCGFPNNHVWIWEFNHKEGWVLKNWCFWTLMLEKILDSSLDSKEFKPVTTKGNQAWIFTGKTDVEARIFWPYDVKGQLTGKDPDSGQNWGQENKGATKNEMGGWHHWFNGHESEQTLGDSEGQECLACYSPWGHK